MSMLADMAFGAIEHFIREEADKLIAGKLNSIAINQLLAALGTRIADLAVLKGNVNFRLSGIRIGYTGTAMKKTQSGIVELADREIPVVIEQNYASSGKKGPNGTVKFSSDLKLENIGFTKSVGMVKATIDSLTLHFEADGTAESGLKA